MNKHSEDIARKFSIKLQSCSSHEHLKKCLKEISSDTGIEIIAYINIGLSKSAYQTPVLIGSYDPIWTEHYFGHRFGRMDPVMQNAIHSHLPFFWGAPGTVVPARPEQEQFFREAADFGIHHGWTVPVHDAAGRVSTLSFCASGSFEAFGRIIATYETALHVIAVHFHASARANGTAPPCASSADVRLTNREVECLEWAAQGKSRTDTGQILGLSPRTIKFHLERAQRKLNVASTRQAVLKAALHGLIAM
jgi:LuxR family transcriptional regulator, activator of conjugal transfer of Ti plasmids